MRLFIVLSFALAWGSVQVAEAQQPGRAAPSGAGSQVSGQLSPTPEMWFYEQYMKNYSDPRLAVRRNAEFQQQQRENRLAAMRWFGMSNSRPRSSPDPFNGDYSPYWASTNRAFPYQWNAVGHNYVILPRSNSAEK